MALQITILKLRFLVNQIISSIKIQTVNEKEVMFSLPGKAERRLSLPDCLDWVRREVTGSTSGWPTRRR